MTRFLSLAFAGLLTLTGTVTAAEDGTPLSGFQQRIPGPQRLPMVQADDSGKVQTDPGFLADRLAILNHVTAYAYLIDEGRWEEWYALFADDVLFESTVPCFGTIRAKGKEAFRAFTDARYRGPGSEANMTVRRHLMGNLHVARQTADEAFVRTYMLIMSAPPVGGFHPITSGTYNATLEKRDGRWTITRWYIEVDAPVKPSPIPEGIASDTLEFVPDDRLQCKR